MASHTPPGYGGLHLGLTPKLCTGIHQEWSGTKRSHSVLHLPGTIHSPTFVTSAPSCSSQKYWHWGPGTIYLILNINIKGFIGLYDFT